MKKTPIKTFNHPQGWFKLARVNHDERVAYELFIDINGDFRTFLITGVSELTAIARGCTETDKILREHKLPPVDWSKENI